MARLVRIFAVACALAPAASRADARDDVRAAAAFYEEYQFQRCVTQLEKARREPLELALQAQVELYLGLCRYDLGDAARAEDHFRLALRLDPTLRLPPLTSPKIARLFEGLRERLASTGAPTGGTAPQQQASAQSQVVEGADAAGPERGGSAASGRPSDQAPTSTVPAAAVAPLSSEPRASQAGRRGPAVLTLAVAGGAVAFLGAGIYLGLEARRLESEANASPYDWTGFQTAERARGRALGANLSFAVAASAACGAVVLWLLEEP